MNTTQRRHHIWHRDPYGVAFAGLLILLFLFFAIASLI